MSNIRVYKANIYDVRYLWSRTRNPSDCASRTGASNGCNNTEPINVTGL